MPIIILVGEETLEYVKHIENQFKNRYTIQRIELEFVKIRSILSNQDKNKLYILSGLTKPERYEIYCLARKNDEKFLLISKREEDFVSSDKNQLVLAEYDDKIVAKRLDESKIANTQANKRSKGVSLRGLRDIKSLIKQINEDKKYNKEKSIAEILKLCEERVIKACIKGLSGSYDSEEIEKCYCQMVEKEMESKGISLDFQDKSS